MRDRLNFTMTVITENQLINFTSWPLKDNNSSINVSIWMLAGFPSSVQDCLFPFFQTVDKTVLFEMFGEFFHTESGNLKKTSWLDDTKMGIQLFRFNLKVAFVSFKCVNVFNADQKLQPEYEMEILLHHQNSFYREQSSQELFSDDQIRNDIENVREFNEDI